MAKAQNMISWPNIIILGLAIFFLLEKQLLDTKMVILNLIETFFDQN
jgi:hypothetical protein